MTGSKERWPPMCWNLTKKEGFISSVWGEYDAKRAAQYYTNIGVNIFGFYELESRYLLIVSGIPRKKLK